MVKPKVFLDSSVLIAAVLSSSGGSFFILSQLRNKFEFQINKFVFEEVVEVLARKFSNYKELHNKFLLLLGLAGVTILDNPSKQKIKNVLPLISKEDSSILASAFEHSSYLVTLDNDFLTKKVLAVAKAKQLHILKPKDFILQNR